MIYRAVNAEAGEAELRTFEEGLWGRRYPAIAHSWRARLERGRAPLRLSFRRSSDLVPTNAIEALNAALRRAVRARGHFPTDEAAMELLFLGLNRSKKERKMAPREWVMAKVQLAVIFGERFTRAIAA